MKLSMQDFGLIMANVAIIQAKLQVIRLNMEGMKAANKARELNGWNEMAYTSDHFFHYAAEADELIKQLVALVPAYVPPGEEEEEDEKPTG